MADDHAGNSGPGYLRDAGGSTCDRCGRGPPRPLPRRAGSPRDRGLCPGGALEGRREQAQTTPHQGAFGGAGAVDRLRHSRDRGNSPARECIQRLSSSSAGQTPSQVRRHHRAVEGHQAEPLHHLRGGRESGRSSRYRLGDGAAREIQSMPGRECAGPRGRRGRRRWPGGPDPPPGGGKPSRRSSSLPAKKLSLAQEVLRQDRAEAQGLEGLQARRPGAPDPPARRAPPPPPGLPALTGRREDRGSMGKGIHRRVSSGHLGLGVRLGILAGAGELRKPNPVSHRHAKGVAVSGHSSRAAIAGGLQQPTRKRPPRRAGRAARDIHFPIWSCSAWGLPCLAPSPAERCALTAPFHPYRRRSATGGLLSAALSVASLRLAVSEHAARGSSDFPPAGNPGRRPPVALRHRR